MADLIRVVSLGVGKIPKRTGARPRWVPDDEVSQCRDCRSKFDELNRKHHCRYCGNIFCGSCVPNKVSLPKHFEYDKPQRVCAICLETIRSITASPQFIHYQPTTPIQNSNTDKLMLYVARPSVSGSSLKPLSKQTNLKEIIRDLTNQLPVSLRSDRYHLFHAGLQMLDESKTLCDYSLKDGDLIELKRGFEWELVLLGLDSAPLRPTRSALIHQKRGVATLTDSPPPERPERPNGERPIHSLPSRPLNASSEAFGHRPSSPPRRPASPADPLPEGSPKSPRSNSTLSQSHSKGSFERGVRPQATPQSLGYMPSNPNEARAVRETSPVRSPAAPSSPRGGRPTSPSPQLRGDAADPQPPARPDLPGPPPGQKQQHEPPRPQSAKPPLPTQPEKSPLPQSEKPVDPAPLPKPAQPVAPPTSRDVVYLSDTLSLAESTTLIRKLAYPTHTGGGGWTYTLSSEGGSHETPSDKTFAAAFPLLEGEFIQICGERIDPKTNQKSLLIQKLQVVFSPLSECERQQKLFLKSGWLNVLTGGSWTSRWVDLTPSSIIVYKNQPKPDQEAKIKVFISLAGYTNVSVIDKASGTTYHTFTTYSGNCQVQLGAQDLKLVQSWHQSVNSIGVLARTIDKYRNPKKPSQQEDTQMSSKSISLPFNARHNLSVGDDWQWQGDVSVFLMEESIGRGVSGKVYRATVRDINFEVAIKIVVEDLEVPPSTPSVYGRHLLPSPQLVAHVVQVLADLEKEDYCGVGSLKDGMNLVQDTFAEKQIAYILLHTLSGLNYIHEKNLLHMDIKAANILLTETGIVKLADFGVSLLLGASRQHTTESYIGSPLFMAPEVILLQPIVKASDIWSLGITMIELGEGSAPNSDINCVEKMPELAQRDPPTFKNPRQWSSDCIDLLSQMLKKDKMRRPSALNLTSHPFFDPSYVPGPECLRDFISMAMSLKKKR